MSDPLCTSQMHAHDYCDCDLIARVRADERERMERLAADVTFTETTDGRIDVYACDPHGVGWTPVALSLVPDLVNNALAARRLARAEEVAARLVEEVCRDEVLIQTLHGALIEAADQRDAARAEVAALRERLDAFPMIAMIGIELREADARREALADLRAKVAAEHDASLVGTDSDYELGWRQAYRRVLALFDEAAQ